MPLNILNKTSNINYYSKISWKYHVVFWLIYFTINTLRWASYHNDYMYALGSNLLGFPIHMALCYLNIYVLMPYFIFRKKYSIYILAIISAIFTMVVVKFNLTYYLLDTNVWPEGPVETNTLTPNYVIDMMIGELYVITFVTAIKITADWLKENKRLNDLEKLQLQTELLFLKTQISPHFFFNTLNNIYSLAIEKSDKTPKIILKLSDLMRYLLYETKHEKQTLANEIMCLQDYLELERIRHGDNLEINMDISGDISDKKIAPILLLSFVENAFKHGVNKNIGKIKIDIDFNIKEEFLYFTITNPTPDDTTHKQHTEKVGGIGLKNVKKRLALDYKKDQYDLKIFNADKLFTVKLKIKVG